MAEFGFPLETKQAARPHFCELQSALDKIILRGQVGGIGLNESPEIRIGMQLMTDNGRTPQGLEMDVL
ncbi:MAG: hypothetical protein NTZ26_09765, partial [Candidatus Aminicenantes bacterium]|nr:hypothetical protein [Candidatus Aminicenantes bacterium]